MFGKHWCQTHLTPTDWLYGFIFVTVGRCQRSDNLHRRSSRRLNKPSFPLFYLWSETIWNDLPQVSTPMWEEVIHPHRWTNIDHQYFLPLSFKPSPAAGFPSDAELNIVPVSFSRSKLLPFIPFPLTPLLSSSLQQLQSDQHLAAQTPTCLWLSHLSYTGSSRHRRKTENWWQGNCTAI